MFHTIHPDKGCIFYRFTNAIVTFPTESMAHYPGMEGSIITAMAKRKRSPLEIKTTEAHMCTISARLKILGQVPFFQDLTSADLEWVNSLFHEEGFKVG